MKTRWFQLYFFPPKIIRTVLPRESSKIPFSLSIALPALLWVFLCALFCYLFIIAKADFQVIGTKKIFTLSLLLFVILSAICSVIEYGGLRLLGIKKERKQLRVLNDNIVDGHLLPNITSETLKEVFYSLSKSPIDPIIAGSKYIILTVLFVLSVEWVVSGTATNIPIILVGGVITLFLYVLFVGFFTENSIFFPLKECRELLLKRGEKIKEPGFRFNELRTRFNLLLLIPALVILIVLNFIAVFNLEIILLFIIGLSLIAIIGRVLSLSIYRALSEIKDFAKRLQEGERTLFTTGSLDKGIVSLSEALNQAANKIYTSRKELEEAKTSLEIKVKIRTKELAELNIDLEQKIQERTQELQKRVKELNKFYKLTVGRELKMAELKKEIRELEKRLEKE